MGEVMVAESSLLLQTISVEIRSDSKDAMEREWRPVQALSCERGEANALRNGNIQKRSHKAPFSYLLFLP
jgi:hypothetical protein